MREKAQALMWIGAQYVAHRFAYHPNLGAPLYGPSPDVRRMFMFAALAFIGAAASFAAHASLRRLAIPLLALAGIACMLRSAPIYGPFQFLRWSIAYRDVPKLAGIISRGVFVAGVTGLTTALGALFLTGSLVSRRTTSGCVRVMGAMFVDSCQRAYRKTAPLRRML